MSQEERLMILQMVADKKISASEAAELLKALDEKSATARGPSQSESATNRVPPNPRGSSNPAGLGSGLSAFIEEVVDRVTDAFGEFTGPRHEFPTEISGVFADQEVPLRIFTRNGHVELKGWDQPGFKAALLVKARGSSEAEARGRAADAYTVKADEHGFSLETNRSYDWSDLAVNITLYLPRERIYRLESRTGNGHILVEGVSLVEGSGTTGNGRITFRGSSADRLYVKSGNGSIELDGDMASLEAGTGNGSVRVIPLGRRSESIQVKTGNGSIVIDTGRLSRETGLFVDAQTGMGGVTIERNDLVYERDQRSVGYKHVTVRSREYEGAERRVSIHARTGLGSITLE